MSGLAGTVSFGRHRCDARTVERMCALLRHRGPDALGVHRTPNGKAVIGIARRGLVPGEAELPLSSERRDVWLAFDGAIYNHRALRHSLELDGHLFRSRDESEVVLHAYEQYGLDFLDHLQGIFALALWDQRQGRLVLARDRLGKKPLYWLERPDYLAFASEIKALVDTVPHPRRMDSQALAQYLSVGHVAAPLTLFEGIYKLGPGEALVMERGGQTRRFGWWRPCRDPRRRAQVAALALPEHVTNLRVLLESAVADRLGGGPPAALFDGAPESAAIIAAMGRLMGRSVEALAVVDPDADPAQRSALQAFSQSAGARLREIEVGQAQALAMLPDFVRHMDEPVADARAVHVWWAARHASGAGMPTVLSAEGACEIGLGAPEYLGERRLQSLIGLHRRLPPRLSRWMLRLLGLMGQQELGEKLRRAISGEPTFLGRDLLFVEQAKEAVVADPLRNYVTAWPEAGALERLRAEMPAWLQDDPLAAVSYQEVRLRLAESELMRSDKMAMAHGVEVREPFLDPALVDYLLSIPGAVRAQGGRPGHLLRQAIGAMMPPPMVAPAGALPGPAIDAWFGDGLGEAFEETVRSARLFQDGVLDAGVCQAILARHRRGEEPAGGRLWALQILAEWYDQFRVDGIAHDGLRIVQPAEAASPDAV